MNEDVYKTKDFYTATCILASRYPLIKLNRLTHKTVEFVFSIPQNKAEEIIQKHWSRNLKVSSRDFTDAISELKTRIYDKNL